MKVILVDAIDTFVIKGEGIFKPMFDLLEEYPNRKITLTNANDEQMVKFGLTNVPYELFTLKHNPDKTDPEYFKQMLNRFNLTPHDVIYFEHNLEAVKSAQSVGILSYHYDSATRDLKALRHFLDKAVVMENNFLLLSTWRRLSNKPGKKEMLLNEGGLYTLKITFFRSKDANDNTEHEGNIEVERMSKLKEFVESNIVNNINHMVFNAGNTIVYKKAGRMLEVVNDSRIWSEIIKLLPEFIKDDKN